VEDGAVIFKMNTHIRAMQHPHRHVATAIWRTERKLIPPNIEAAGMPRKKYKRESRRERPRVQRERCSLLFTTP
jgi:hypothetical protein